tara:strand:+ start:577 stop:1176 length:600 start_codon:yes stop_codon:yes gene_type:complete
MLYLNLTALLIGYLFGSFNSAILVCKLFKLPSPRSIGSGNPGATNVLRLGGKIPAFLTLAGDLLKGLIPVLLAHLLDYSSLVVALVALAAIIGHIYPIFFGFKGGKGVATLIGVMFGYYWILGIFFAVIWLLVALLTRYSSLSSIIATIAAPIFVYFYAGNNICYVFIVMALLVVIRHKDNIQRLVAGTESKVGKKSKA